MVGEKAKGTEEKERKSKEEERRREEKRREEKLITKMQKQRNNRGNKKDRKGNGREEVRIEWKRGEGEERRKNCDTLWWKDIIRSLQ